MTGIEHGFISLHRSILIWEWYHDLSTKAVFVHLLLTANYQEIRWSGMVIKRGQRVCSRSSLARELGMSEQSVRTSLSRLKRTGEIGIQPSTKFSIITVKNYDKYQISTQQPTNSQPATTQQQTSIQPIATQQQANSQSTDTQRITLDQPQWNKDNKDNNSTLPIPPEEGYWKEGGVLLERFWEAYPKKIGYEEVTRWFNRYIPDRALVEQMIAAIGRHRQSIQWTKSDGRYIPRPSQWLMRNEWKNELLIEVKKPSEADGLDSGNVAQLLETKFMDEMAEASGGVE